MGVSMGYNMMEEMEGNSGILVSKHERFNNRVAEMLWELFKKSDYTKTQLASILGWTEHRLMMVMSGDKTITTFEMVHVAGALGKSFKVGFL